MPPSDGALLLALKMLKYRRKRVRPAGFTNAVYRWVCQAVSGFTREPENTWIHILHIGNRCGGCGRECTREEKPDTP